LNLEISSVKKWNIKRENKENSFSNSSIEKEPKKRTLKAVKYWEKVVSKTKSVHDTSKYKYTPS